MRSISRVTAWIGAAALATFMVGCSNTGEGLKKDAEENREKAEAAASDAREKAIEATDKAENAVDRAADATAAAGRAAADAAATAGRATGDAASSAGRTLSAAAKTAEIKTALLAAKDIDSGGIDVDTNGDTHVVLLKGHVPTAAQKTRAGEIAAKKAEDYKIDNQLVVRK
jgi:osmotically-inducible protein OsmY